MNETLAILEDADTARVALSPLRRQLLARLKTPASASQLSEELGITRQKLGYHIRVLVEAGLIAEVETRQRRGFIERLYETRSEGLLIDPMLLAHADHEVMEEQDQFAAEHLLRTAAGMVRDVSRMRKAAAEDGSRLLTFTIEADVAFAVPSDMERFADRLADAVSSIAADFAPLEEGRAYRVTIAGHPAASAKAKRWKIN